MSWLKIFKGVDVGKVIESGMKGADNLFFTNEEKAEYNAEIVKAHTEYIAATLSENTVRSKSRRFIAVLIVSVYLFLIVAGVIIYPFYQEYATFILTNINEMLGSAFLATTGFYFGAHLLRTSIAQYREKKVKKEKT